MTFQVIDKFNDFPGHFVDNILRHSRSNKDKFNDFPGRGMDTFYDFPGQNPLFQHISAIVVKHLVTFDCIVGLLP